MRVIVPGHRYEVSHLKSDGKSIIQFHQDPEIHGSRVDGTWCQELIRVLIDRVNILDAEKPWAGNDLIKKNLRLALAGFEARAILVKAEKGIPIEHFEIGEDGHLLIGG